VAGKETENQMVTPTTTTEAFNERNDEQNAIFDEFLVLTVVGTGITSVVLVLIIINLLFVIIKR
jgi:hypothetical protein